MSRKALFLDRDGVINKERGDYVFRREEFEFEPGIFELGRIAVQSGFLLIGITNQGGIQKGLYSIEETDTLHQWMCQRFEEEFCPLTDIYLSPYHKNFSKNILSKPSSLMIEKACAKYGINPRLSWMIGDRARDVEAGKRVGCSTVGIGPDARNSGADFWAGSVAELIQSQWIERLTLSGSLG